MDRYQQQQQMYPQQQMLASPHFQQMPFQVQSQVVPNSWVPTPKAEDEAATDFPAEPAAEEEKATEGTEAEADNYDSADEGDGDDGAKALDDASAWGLQPSQRMVVGQVPTVPTEPHWRTQRQTMRAEDFIRRPVEPRMVMMPPIAPSPRMPIIRSAEHLVRGPFSPTNNVPRGFPF